MELLLGCGNQRKKAITIPECPKHWTELITLDIDPGVKPTYCHDLTDLPLPFDDNCFDEIHAYEVLEHTGAQGDWRFFFNQFYEFWRIMKPGAYFFATTPMWDGIWAWGDPGHTRIISAGSVIYLSQKEYEVQVGHGSMTDYRPYYEADFDIVGREEDGETFGFVLQAVK